MVGIGQTVRLIATRLLLRVSPLQCLMGPGHGHHVVYRINLYHCFPAPLRVKVISPCVAIYAKRFQAVLLHASFSAEQAQAPAYPCAHENPPMTGGLLTNHRLVVDRALVFGPTRLNLATTLRAILTALPTLADLSKQLFQLLKQFLKAITASSALGASGTLRATSALRASAPLGTFTKLGLNLIPELLNLLIDALLRAPSATWAADVACTRHSTDTFHNADSRLINRVDRSAMPISP